MSDAGGQTTHRGVLYQDKIAALYLGRMLDPRCAKEDPSKQVEEVRDAHIARYGVCTC